MKKVTCIMSIDAHKQDTDHQNDIGESELAIPKDSTNACANNYQGMCMGRLTLPDSFVVEVFPPFADHQCLEKKTVLSMQVILSLSTVLTSARTVYLPGG